MNRAAASVGSFGGCYCVRKSASAPQERTRATGEEATAEVLVIVAGSHVWGGAFIVACDVCDDATMKIGKHEH